MKTNTVKTFGFSNDDLIELSRADMENINGGGWIAVVFRVIGLGGGIAVGYCAHNAMT